MKQRLVTTNSIKSSVKRINLDNKPIQPVNEGNSKPIVDLEEDYEEASNEIHIDKEEPNTKVFIKEDVEEKKKESSSQIQLIKLSK